MIASGTALLLLSAAVGYWVLERANTQKKNLKTIGQIVGAAIILLSFTGVACKTYFLAKYKKYYCPPSATCPSGPICPFSSQKPAGK